MSESKSLVGDHHEMVHFWARKDTVQDFETVTFYVLFVYTPTSLLFSVE